MREVVCMGITRAYIFVAHAGDSQNLFFGHAYHESDPLFNTSLISHYSANKVTNVNHIQVAVKIPIFRESPMPIHAKCCPVFLSSPSRNPRQGRSETTHPHVQ